MLRPHVHGQAWQSHTLSRYFGDVDKEILQDQVRSNISFLLGIQRDAAELEHTHVHLLDSCLPE